MLGGTNLVKWIPIFKVELLTVDLTHFNPGGTLVRDSYKTYTKVNRLYRYETMFMTLLLFFVFD